MYRLLPLLFIFSISLADIKTVAISYFDNTSGTEEYNPLSKGLADMLITDLSNVKSLKIVEREKLESLLKEIELGDGKFIDPNTAQKLGKGLGAGYMLTGSFLIMGETMRIDARLVDVGTGEITMAEEITGEKDTFFELEKNLVNKLVTTLNIDLSKKESRKVKKVQTESFESFNNYSSSIDAFDKGEYEKSKDFMEKAANLDEDFDLAWDRLDDIENFIENLIKQRKLNLDKKTIDAIDVVMETKNEELNFQLVSMMYNLRVEFVNMFNAYEHIENVDGEPKILGRFNNESKNYSNSLDSNLINLVDKLEKYLTVKLYLDSKEFDRSLGGEKYNPWISSWGYTGWYMGFLVHGFWQLEDIYGDEIFMIDLPNNEGPTLASSAINALIADHNLKMLEYFPYYFDDYSKTFLKLALQRKTQPVKKAFLWLSEFFPRLSLSDYALIAPNSDRQTTFYADFKPFGEIAKPDSVILKGLETYLDTINIQVRAPMRLDILKIIDDETSINIKVQGESYTEPLKFSEFLGTVKTMSPPVYDLNDIRTEYWNEYFNRSDVSWVKDGLVTIWYKNGQKRSEGTYKDGKEDGLFTVWDENGQKRSEGTYKDGKEDGLWTHWDNEGSKYEGKVIRKDEEDGIFLSWYETKKKEKLKSYNTWKNGKPNGLLVYWYRNGQKKSEGTYKDGLADGLHTEWYENGQKKSEKAWKYDSADGLHTEWYENGQKKSEKAWKYDSADGLHTEWYENGQKKSEKTYKKDFTGLWTHWHKNGNMQYEEAYKDGSKDSSKLTIEWYENGQKKREGYTNRSMEMSYFNGFVWIGLYTSWHENGQKSSEGSYGKPQKKYINGIVYDIESIKQGKWIYWYSNGQKSSEKTYQDNKFINCKGWDEDGNDCECHKWKKGCI